MEAHEQAAEMAVLAQCKFNETRQHLQSVKNCGRGGGGKVAGGSSKHPRHQKQQEKKPNVSDPDDKAQELFSTLLYLSTMLDKVDGMKAMLKKYNLTLYEEWRPLFDALSSPATALREQFNQEERIKRLEKRKNYYKDDVTKRKVETTRMQEDVQKSESQLKEQITTMSNLIAKVEGRLAEKEGAMESLVNTHSAEKVRLEDELMESKKRCETMQDKLSDLEAILREARVEKKESLAAMKGKDVVIEELRDEINEKGKLLEVQQNELGRVIELEHALQQKCNEISFLRNKLEASDRHQEELARIIAKQQQQQQYLEPKDDPASELTKADDMSTARANNYKDKNFCFQEDIEEPTAAVRVGDNESAASNNCRLEVSSAKGESHNFELELRGEEYEEDAVGAAAEENGSVDASSTTGSSTAGIDTNTSTLSNLNCDKDKVKEEAEEAATDGDEDISLAAEAKDVRALSIANMATGSSGVVDGDDGDEAATSILASIIDETQEQTNIMTNITCVDYGKITNVVAQKAVDDAVKEAVNSCT